jgi:hypothetical protein
MEKQTAIIVAFVLVNILISCFHYASSKTTSHKGKTLISWLIFLAFALFIPVSLSIIFGE